MIKINYPREQIMKLTLSDFKDGISTKFDSTNSSFSQAFDIKNFSFEKGPLMKGVGFDDFFNNLNQIENLSLLKQDIKTIGDLCAVFHFYKYNNESNKREDKLIIIDAELKVYSVDLYDNNPVLNYLRDIKFTSKPEAIRYRLNGEDVIILTSPTDNMVVWNGVNNPYQVIDAPKISSMAIHYERLFATVDGEKNAVWFSDDLDPTNWSLNLEDAGFIELIDERGALIKVVSFLDYIYIFREFGISRLSAFGDQSNFSIANLYVSSGKIYDKSVCVCGDKILFLANDGLYRFDGVDTTKILTNISSNISFINEQEVNACYHNGYYYLACKYRFNNNDSKEVSEALLKIDVNTMKVVNISYGVDIKHLCVVNIDNFNGVVAITSNNEDSFITNICDSGKYIDRHLSFSWLSPKSTVGDAYTQKTLKEINIDATGEFSLEIYHDDKTSIYNFNTNGKPINKRVNIPLYLFSFKISSINENLKLNSIQFVFGKPVV